MKRFATVFSVLSSEGTLQREGRTMQTKTSKTRRLVEKSSNIYFPEFAPIAILENLEPGDFPCCH
jgi:hypothetical protein